MRGRAMNSNEKEARKAKVSVAKVFVVLAVLSIVFGCEEKGDFNSKFSQYSQQSSNSNTRLKRPQTQRPLRYSSGNSYSKRFPGDGGWSREEAAERFKQKQSEEYAWYENMSHDEKVNAIRMRAANEKCERESNEYYGSQRKWGDHIFDYQTRLSKLKTEEEKNEEPFYKFINSQHCLKCSREAREVIDLPDF